MIKRTPKSECIRKVEQDRSILKILTFGQHLHKSKLFWKLDVCTIFEPRMKKWVPKLECTWKIEWDRSVLKFLIFFFGQDIFFHLYFYIFFFQAVWIRVKPSWSGSNLDQRVSSVGMTSSMTSHCWGRMWHVWHVRHVWHVWPVYTLEGSPAREIWWRRVFVEANDLAARVGAWVTFWTWKFQILQF